MNVAAIGEVGLKGWRGKVADRVSRPVAERTRLFQATSAYLQKRLDIAPGPYQSDEKFVLQLVAALGEGAEGAIRS